MDDSIDIAIVGGGAAGLATAIFAVQAAAPGLRIAIFDGARNLGAKILVAGGGRCNVTHQRITPRDYHGPTQFIKRVLAGFRQPQTVEWFQSLGVTLKTEPTGKLFPVTDSARTVLNALLDRCRTLGVELRTGHRVRSVSAESTDPTRFAIAHEQGVTHASRLVLATGGQSLPRSGSDGHGFALARSLGHTATATAPALVPLKLDAGFFHAGLSGIACEVQLAFRAEARKQDPNAQGQPLPWIASSSRLMRFQPGAMLFTHFGVSGPAIMDASRHWTIAQQEHRSPQLFVSFLQGMGFDEVDRRLLDRAAGQPRRPVARTLSAFLPQRLAEALVRHVGIAVDQPMTELTKASRRSLVHALIELPLPVTGHRGWNAAEVTAGGVPVSEVDHRTMGSRHVPGLHVVGELLDVDGRIGGFNFQWAWATGRIAGEAMAGKTRG